MRKFYGEFAYLITFLQSKISNRPGELQEIYILEHQYSLASSTRDYYETGRKQNSNWTVIPKDGSISFHKVFWKAHPFSKLLDHP